METTYGAAQGGTALAAVMGFVMAFSFLFVAFLVLVIIARWKIFTKAGIEGWKSLIPVYSDYLEWKLSWNNTTLFWVALGLAIGGSLLCNIASSSTDGGLSFLSVLGLILFLGAAVLELMQSFKLFQSFGKGVGWLVGYLFVPNIMLLVLGFGSAQYLGPQD